MTTPEQPRPVARPATFAADVVVMATPPSGLEAAGEVPATRSGGSGYRPHLDGLRAVAVYLVVLFHAGVDRLAGGFIGVDVFFVLSGFLVTRLLLRDLDGGGVVRYGRFYARRFRRLLPASAVALLVTAVAYSAVAGPGEAAGSVDAFRACFLYVANWHFISAAAGYFGAAVQTNPVLHFWSLAVEEQFYVVWPLVLGGLFWLFRRGGGSGATAKVRVVVAVAAVGSLVWALSLQGSNPDRAYYGTDTRAYQLLAGALLALTPGAVTLVARLGAFARWLAIAALGVLLVCATSLVDVGPIWRGALTALLVLILLAALEADQGGPLHAVLRSGPFIYLGRISYGIYLWHWPVIVVATIVADPSSLALTGITVLVATGIATLSYEIFEMPIRRSAFLDRFKMPVIAGGLTISLVCGLVIAPAILRHTDASSGDTAVTATAGFTPVPDDLDLAKVFADKFGTSVTCVDKDPSACTVVRGGGAHILVMGDSNAEMMVPAFTEFAKANDLTLSLAVTRGCPWQRGIRAPLPGTAAACERNREDAYERVIPALKPDIIVGIDAEYPVDLVGPRDLRAKTLASVPQLAAPGRRLVLVEPIMQSPARPQPLACLNRAKFLEDCRYVGTVGVSPMDTIYRGIAAKDPSVLSVDWDRLACPLLPICDPVIGGKVVRWDSQHLATEYAATLGDELAANFRAAGLLAN